MRDKAAFVIFANLLAPLLLLIVGYDLKRKPNNPECYSNGIPHPESRVHICWQGVGHEPAKQNSSW
jgi:hypothetical protein